MPGTTSDDQGNPPEATRAARLGSARADFITSLGRRASELRTLLTGLEQDPGALRLRDDLRRRVHALSAGARLLRFGAMATALAEVERTLERAASSGALAQAEVREIGEILEKLPSFAHSEPASDERPTERPPPIVPLVETAVVPPTILVIGPSGLADAITNVVGPASEAEMECERADSPATGVELARAVAPDVVVIDADLPGARDLVERLVRDPLTEPTPLIVVGTWATPEEGARWVASGASLALAKPISPHDLRKACADLSLGVSEPWHHGPLGQVTVEQLTSVVVSEIQRGLQNALVQGKSTPIQLGDGSDVLAAVWGAVARVRDLVTIKSGGAVRFSNDGPEGAVPIAPWWGEGPQPGTRSAEPKRAAAVRLDGRKVVVADDDPAVTWFIGGLLRAAGAEVREAHDGDRALELCSRLRPDLVITDVLMPGLDGFALCRALKRDIVLRAVPVILLSWKEDLLQRLRDLGADADGYLRKEASAAAILSRVHEVLRARVRLEERLKGDGEVRGRLDGVTPAALLEILARVRPDSRLCIRDASFLYELELREGIPRSATRTTSDGAFQRGRDVFAALLGARTGRFVVSRAQGFARGTLVGDLAMQMETPVAHARASVKMLGGTRLLDVHGVRIGLDGVHAYIEATPEPVRSLVHRIAAGESPRALILDGEIAPAQLEALLCDLAVRGAVLGVHGANGADLLGPALEQELRSIRQGGAPSQRPQWPGDSVTLERVATSADTPAQGTPTDAPRGRVRTRPGVAEPPPRVSAESSPTNTPPSPGSAPPPAPAPPVVSSGPVHGDEDRTPSSLEAAVIREISDRTPKPPPAARALPGANLVGTPALKSRASSPPVPKSDPPLPPVPSLPPDAIVPATSEERIHIVESATSGAVVPGNPSEDSMKAFDLRVVAPTKSRPRSPEPPGPEAQPPPARRPPQPHPITRPRRAEPARGGFVIGGLVALAALALLVVGLQYQKERSTDEADAVSTDAVSPTDSAAIPQGVPSVAPLGGETTEGAGAAASAAASATVETAPLPMGIVVTPTQGLLDIETGTTEAIFVDGVEIGRGPSVRLTLGAGSHEVRLRGRDDERVRSVIVQPSRRTHLALPSTSNH